MTILLDVESVSKADLPKIGGRLYWEHPTTKPLVVVLHDTETGERGAWYPGDPCPVEPGSRLGAHNWSGFDRFAAIRLGWIAADDHTGLDTSESARRGGLPGALDAAGTRLLGIPKDKESSKYTVSLSKFDDIADACPPLESDETDKKVRARERTAQRKAWRAMPRARRLAAVLNRVTTYCDSDVDIMVGVEPVLRPYEEDGVFGEGGFEHDVLTVDRIVNDRGICFDRELALRLIDCDARLQELAIKKAAKHLGWSVADTRAVAGSPAKFCAETGLPDAQAKTIELAIAAGQLDADGLALCAARQALAVIASGKLIAGLARVSSDGRLRDMMRYYGAHTGRWSGRGMQLQNMPRPAKRFEDWDDADVCALADKVMRGYWPDADEIDLLLRATLTASPGHVLIAEDFSGVEARALAWCAKDRDALEVFASGVCPYRTEAAKLFGVTYDDIPKQDPRRNAGKMGVLACGYQGGVAGLLRVCRSNGVDLEKIGVNPQDVIDSWREAHAPVVRFWKQLNDAFKGAIQGRSSKVDRFEFYPSDDGRDVAIFLPSGRPIVYNGVGLAQGDYGPSPFYVGAYGTREHVYGGKIAENVIQAMCRDLMADALVRAEEAGLCPVLHVHDEIVCDVARDAAKDAAAELHQIMLKVPRWARTFPIGAAGHIGKRYRK